MNDTLVLSKMISGFVEFIPESYYKGDMTED
jgi:hypothetical protein